MICTGLEVSVWVRLIYEPVTMTLLQRSLVGRVGGRLLRLRYGAGGRECGQYRHVDGIAD